MQSLDINDVYYCDPIESCDIEYAYCAADLQLEESISPKMIYRHSFVCLYKN